MSPMAHLFDDCAKPLTCKYESWIQSSFVETIPTMKFSHPILSCKVLNSWTIDGSSPVHLMQEISPLLWAYFKMTEMRSGCISFSFIHLESSFTNCKNASMRPTSGQWRMCVHVSSHNWQLGQVDSWPSWCAKNFIVPAIPRTCFEAQT